MSIRSCCGGGGGIRRPAGPPPAGSVTLIYVGSRSTLFRVAERRYPVGPTRRTVLAPASDADELIATGDFVRRP